MSFFNIPFIQVVSPFIEASHPYSGAPDEYVCELSHGKADAIAALHPAATIISADTIVVREGKIYGKPKDSKEAIKTLQELSGQWHSVYTGVTVRKANEVHSAAEETKVQFNPLTLENIHAYVNRLHCIDKAGSYAVQMGGSLAVRKIEGCFYNVMGLPVNTLSQLLNRVGVNLWNHIRG